mmetsp:Transcript_15979/g.23514  ORF Transcript_15979/g.23514 Transcript_15979/m.23514 type:complete len:219 (+) Transcript_15979:344-1000(+)
MRSLDFVSWYGFIMCNWRGHVVPSSRKSEWPRFTRIPSTDCMGSTGSACDGRLQHFTVCGSKQDLHARNLLPHWRGRSARQVGAGDGDVLHRACDWHGLEPGRGHHVPVRRQRGLRGGSGLQPQEGHRIRRQSVLLDGGGRAWLPSGPSCGPHGPPLGGPVWGRQGGAADPVRRERGPMRAAPFRLPDLHVLRRLSAGHPVRHHHSQAQPSWGTDHGG